MKECYSNKIYFAPDWRKSNPYQWLLYKNLENQNFKCIGIGKFSLNYIIHTIHGKGKGIVHLHWLYGLCKRNSHYTAVVLSVLILMAKLILIRLFKNKIVFTNHNFGSHETKFKNLENFLTAFCIFISDSVVVHTKAGFDFIRTQYKIRPDKIWIIPHGNYIGYYENSIGRIEARNKLGLGQKEKVFLFFGQLREYKGVEELIVAFKKCKKENYRLIIAGKPQNDKIKTIIDIASKNDSRIVTSLKFIQEERVQCYFNACDIVVLPYKKILSSGTILLALSFGKFIIAPKDGDAIYILSKSVSYLYKRNKKISEEILEKSIKHHSNNYNFNKTLNLAQQYSWEKICLKYRKMYRHLLNNPRL